MVKATCACTVPADTGLLVAFQPWPSGVCYAVVQVSCARSRINSCFLSVVGLVNFNLIGSWVTVVWQHRVNVLSRTLCIAWWHQQTAFCRRRTRPWRELGRRFLRSLGITTGQRKGEFLFTQGAGGTQCGWKITYKYSVGVTSKSLPFWSIFWSRETGKYC